VPDPLPSSLTVAALLAELSRLDPAAPVYGSGDGRGFAGIGVGLDGARDRQGGVPRGATAVAADGAEVTLRCTTGLHIGHNWPCPVLPCRLDPGVVMAFSFDCPEIESWGVIPGASSTQSRHEACLAKDTNGDRWIRKKARPPPSGGTNSNAWLVAEIIGHHIAANVGVPTPDACADLSEIVFFSRYQEECKGWAPRLLEQPATMGAVLALDVIIKNSDRAPRNLLARMCSLSKWEIIAIDHELSLLANPRALKRSNTPHNQLGVDPLEYADGMRLASRRYRGLVPLLPGLIQPLTDIMEEDVEEVIAAISERCIGAPGLIDEYLESCGVNP
jgi:hypothetical protein